MWWWMRTKVDQRAFSLMEIMVSMALMSIFFVLISKSMNLVVKANAKSTNQNDQLRGVRIFFDQWGYDLQSAIVRRDVDFVIKNSKKTEGGEVKFISKTKAPSGDRPLSGIHFRLRGEADQFWQLERGQRGFGWDDFSWTGLKSGGIHSLLKRWKSMKGRMTPC